MNWIWRHLRAIWGRVMVRAANRRLDALERAARGMVPPKRINDTIFSKFPRGIHK